MKKIIKKSAFKKQLSKLIQNSRFKLDVFENIITNLYNNKKLESIYKSHKLKGELKEFSECHIQNDILVIYTNTKTELTLYQIGSHSQIFKNM